jgi:hypothetical protein
MLPVYKEGTRSEGGRTLEGFFAHIIQDQIFKAKEVEILRRYNVPLILID